METAERIKPKLWEEMTHQEQGDLVKSWAQQTSDFRQKLEDDYWKSQDVIRLLRDRPAVHCAAWKDYPPADKSDAQLPEEPGYYLWFVCDWGYLDVGLVHVSKDDEKHLAYLSRKLEGGSRTFLVYKNSKGETLTMYHQANDHLPHWNKDGVPWVDEYVPFNVKEMLKINHHES